RVDRVALAWTRWRTSSIPPEGLRRVLVGVELAPRRAGELLGLRVLVLLARQVHEHGERAHAERAFRRHAHRTERVLARAQVEEAPHDALARLLAGARLDDQAVLEAEHAVDP